MIACVHAPDLALQAMLRGMADAAERTGAVGLAAGSGGRAALLSVTASAAAAGVHPGMTVAQARAVLPSLRVLTARAADVDAAAAALTDLGLSFAPRVDVEPERVFFQVGDLGALYPDLASVAHAVRARAVQLGLQVHVGIASGKGLARVASRVAGVSAIALGAGGLCPPEPIAGGFGNLLQVPESIALGAGGLCPPEPIAGGGGNLLQVPEAIGEIVLVPAAIERARASLAPWPLAVLDPGPAVAASLQRWGLRTVGDLARLPAAEVTVRLGAAGARLARLATAIDDEPFLPRPPADAVEEGTELDYGIDSLEPLAFVLRGLIERALARLQCRGLACAGMVLRLQVEPHGFDVRDVPLQSPTREPSILLQLVRLDLARRPPDAPVTGLTIMVHPARVRATQLDMLRPNGPAPDRLAATLARLHALVGSEHVGTPRAPDVWREESLAVEAMIDIMRGPDTGELRPTEARHGEPVVGMRRFRPPQDVEVLMGHDGPTAFRGAHATARILIAAGPYRVSGAWWSGAGVHRDYWDVHASDGAVYRMHQERESGRWFLDGYYD